MTCAYRCISPQCYEEVYAKDEEKFFKDFAAAFGKLLALGCPQCSVEPSLLDKIRGFVGL